MHEVILPLFQVDLQLVQHAKRFLDIWKLFNDKAFNLSLYHLKVLVKLVTLHLLSRQSHLTLEVVNYSLSFCNYGFHTVVKTNSECLQLPIEFIGALD